LVLLLSFVRHLPNLARLVATRHGSIVLADFFSLCRLRQRLPLWPPLRRLVVRLLWVRFLAPRLYLVTPMHQGVVNNTTLFVNSTTLFANRTTPDVPLSIWYIQRGRSAALLLVKNSGGALRAASAFRL
jgi:hypothetical protein